MVENLHNSHNPPTPGTGADAFSQGIFCTLQHEEVDTIIQDQLALTAWIKGVVHDIIKTHSNLLHMPVEVQYSYAHLRSHPAPFHLVDDGKISGKAIVKITLPKEKDAINPVIFPHIVHHELSHITNPHYETLRKNRLSPSEISELNTIDQHKLFGSMHIKNGIKEVVTDLTALQLQKFDTNSWISFLTTVEHYMRLVKSHIYSRGSLRDIIRFIAILRTLKPHMQFPEYVQLLIDQLQVMGYVIHADLLPIQKEHLQKTEAYMEEITEKFFKHEL